ncbi:S1C family serine protease [Weissella halotolerans]|uniref:S1 family peptidase n=1 Tax=Weissella halotolerans DSM 20190 TaxID=1123500 RepID=A0A0R2FSE6_9LACO|nr:trypsin-like peptidase domain-containing protein [Weissella halotolerans]KRN31232.1 S1 family peptidase [Weissella halotolerans DSM 20190]
MQKRNGMKFSKQTVVVSLVAGLLGGGVAAGAVTYFGQEQTNSTVKKEQTVKVEPSQVKGESSATQAFNKVSGAVVSVINLQKKDAISQGDLFDTQRTDATRDGNSALEAASEGSGVIYKKDNRHAYIVTNNHVVAGSKQLQVLLSDGTKLSAKLVGTDEVTDLAVLRVDASKVKQVASFANSNKIETGETVLAIGSPLGSDYATSVTEGIISAKKREVVAQSESGQALGKATVIQTDAAINPGNSGGPLVNLAGQVVGINSMKLASSTDGTSVEGMGFAIPSDTVVKIIDDLEKSGKVTRPSLGVSLLDLGNISVADQADVLNLPSKINQGVVVMKISAGSPAAEGGLKRYDVISQVDDTSIKNVGDLRDALYKHQVGDQVKLTIYRDGQPKTLTLHLNKAQNG